MYEEILPVSVDFFQGQSDPLQLDPHLPWVVRASSASATLFEFVISTLFAVIVGLLLIATTASVGKVMVTVVACTYHWVGLFLERSIQSGYNYG